MTITISVPASTANIGPGFDSVGLAINRYLKLSIEKSDNWDLKQGNENLPPCASYRDHFIYKVAARIAHSFAKELPPSHITIENEIPLARGMGSSAAAVIAGIEWANIACDLNLSTDQKLTFATELEGHADNVAPALLGGFVITAGHYEAIDYLKVDSLDLDIVLYIPKEQLKTDDSRNVLPQELSRTQAATASAISNLLIGALLSGDYQLAGKMMELDLFHEPYRAKLIPDYEKIKHFSKKYGAFGTVISGAGPSMISFSERGTGSMLAQKMSEFLPDHEVAKLNIDHQGTQVNKKE